MGRTASDTANVLLDLLAGGSSPDAQAGIDPACLLHVPGRSGLSGTFQGADAIAGLLRRMIEFTAGTLQFDLRRCFMSGQRMVVVTGHQRASRGERTLDADVAYVARLSQGRICEVWISYEDQSQFDEFWA